MRWLYANTQIDDKFSTLGKIQGDVYKVCDHASDILNEINCKLLCEDQTLRTFRRAIGSAQYVKTDLIPFLVNVKDHKLIDTIIRILVNLTVPVECLFSIEIMMRTEAGRHTISDLSTLLNTSKESFTDVRATRAIVDYMKSILEKDSKLSVEQCDSLNNCLLLVRNILHIPETINGRFIQSNHFISMQNQIVWNLFTLSIDKLLIHLMSCPQRAFWCVTMVQLIAVMYKDQHAGTLQQLLNSWFEDSLSDSSEDFESNTSSPKEGSGDSTPMLTSDRTSDSSDNGGGKVETSGVKPQKICASISNRNKSCGIKQPIQQSNSPKASTSSSNLSPPISFDKDKFAPTSELSDCGYGTQVENQESISTSSNEDNYPCQKIHQKPPCNQKQRYNAVNNPRSAITAQEHKDLRRKKLVKRSKSSLINMKGLLHHKPSDEDITNILKEFTIDFLLKAYGFLVQELYTKLFSESDLQVQIDTSDFFWLVNYFLKIAAQLELDLDYVKCVLSFNIISYLTYEAVSLFEQLELTSRRQEMDIKPSLRRMHLVVTAIHEFLQALNTYNHISHLSTDDANYIRLLRSQISATEDLKHLFILLIRNYNPLIQSKQYLKDLIVTNHILLLIPDDLPQYQDQNRHVNLMEHIKQFATVEIMQQYGLLLETYYENGEYVNDCIFTMMHHISGDLGQMSTLFQPNILKTYSQIWETEYELCDDWSDLIEYVIHKFINTPQKSPLTIVPPSLAVEMTVNQDSEKEFCDDVWSKEEIDILYWYYEQSKACSDAVGQIIKLFSDSGYKAKYRITVIQQLLQQDIITRSEYNKLMKYENEEYERNFKTTPTPTEPATPTGIDSMESSDQTEKYNDDVQVLKDTLFRENKGNQILWLQKVLVEYCFAKLCLANNRIGTSISIAPNKITMVQPNPLYSIVHTSKMNEVHMDTVDASQFTIKSTDMIIHGDKIEMSYINRQSKNDTSNEDSDQEDARSASIASDLTHMYVSDEDEEDYSIS